MSLDLTADSPELAVLLGRLSLEEKVRLLTGRDFWTTWPLEKIGLRRILVSDGPSGVRGEVWDERSPSLNLPSATALSSSWDPAIARRYGSVAAMEARRKDVDVVLGPTINLHRSPLGGRHFEAFSEDPVLTADLAAAYVAGVQDNGVGATPKHYVANDYETDRFTASSEVSDRALRELYLFAFEKAVIEARAWLVMSSYNSVNGVTVTESDLLETPLNSEWGFDGVVISDWTAVRSLASAAASQDLVMPGPGGPWGSALVAAVRDGRIRESVIDRKVLRILLLAARVGAIEGIEPAASLVAAEDGLAFAREAEAEGSVLLANDGVLPLNPSALRRVAVIGHNATLARTQGGGSATVLPESVVTPLEGIRAALPEAEVSYRTGAVVQEGIADLPLAQIISPATGKHGMLVRFLDAGGGELFREDRFATALTYFGGDVPVSSAAVAELTLTWMPDVTGDVLLGFAAAGHGRIFVDDALLAEGSGTAAAGRDLGANLLAPPSFASALAVTAGEPRDVRIEFDLDSRDKAFGIFAITVGIETADSRPGELLAAAVASAADADVAIVVVGTSSRVESEGFDRQDLDLPGRQDELVRAVAATGTPTVVIVNAGAPVLLPWREEVAAVLLSYFGGQQMGAALADVLFGVAEPGGRLPTTWPKTLPDVPVLDVTPVDGRVVYAEGIHIGYRAWLKAGTEPAYPFGHGLGYTTWELTDLEADAQLAPGASGTVRLSVTNTGARAGKQVIQVYLSRPDSGVDRPVRWLAAFAPVRAPAGGTVRVEIPLPARAFAYWQDGWQYEDGRYGLQVGTSVLHLPLDASIDLLRARGERPAPRGRAQ